MRKILFITSILFIMFSVSIVTGLTPLNQRHQKMLNQGNEAFNKGEYDTAISIYEELKDAKVYEDTVNYNLGIIYYKTQAYDKALECLKNVKDYKLYGNIYYKLGQISEEIEDKISCFEEAIKQYTMGINNEPNNVELKYNYEFVKKILDELKSEKDKDKNENNSQDNQEQNKNKQEDDDKNQDKNNPQNDKNKNDNKSKDKQNQSKDNDDMKDQGNDEKQDNINDANEKGESEQVGKEQTDIDEETLKQILKLLEQQEKESLKNNQSIINHGKEDGNDW